MAETLEKLHIADLHARAAELGIERYRMLPRAELAAEILKRDPDAEAAAKADAEKRETRREAREGGQREDGRERGGRRRRDDGEEREERDDDRGADREEAEEDAGEPVAGILDVTPRGHGFIRLGGFVAGDDDVYVSPAQIRRCELRRGDRVAGPARAARRGERYPALIHVDTIDGAEPGAERADLADAEAVYPSRRIELRPAPGASAEEALLVRSLDLIAPLARGQRVLVEAAPGAGRTTLLRALAASLNGFADLEVVVLLVDERPEEIPAWRSAAPGAELVVASAEMRSGEQLRLVELAAARAARRAERGADVVLLIDSLSRLGVAAEDPGHAKPIFGAGRETAAEELGSLTVIATTLGHMGEDEGGVERALQTTETSRLVLDPELAAAGVYPAFDLRASRVTGEERLREDAELQAARRLREQLAALPAAEAARELQRRIEGSADNRALLAALSTPGF